MSAFVQSFDGDVYVKIHVASGMIVGSSPKPFPGIDEIEPLEDDTPKPPQHATDPLEMYR